MNPTGSADLLYSPCDEREETTVTDLRDMSFDELNAAREGASWSERQEIVAEFQRRERLLINEIRRENRARDLADGLAAEVGKIVSWCHGQKFYAGRIIETDRKAERLATGGRITVEREDGRVEEFSLRETSGWVPVGRRSGTGAGTVNIPKKGNVARAGYGGPVLTVPEEWS